MALRILVVDDDPTTLEVLRRLLGAEGFEVQVSQRPNDAVSILETGPIDVLLTDLVMAEMSGLQLIEVARGLQPALRCFVMSGHAPGEDVGDDVRWISKPLDLDLLLDAIEGP